MVPVGTQDTHLVIERSARIPVKVTEAEKKKFEKLALSRHTTVSELIRQLLHREADAQNGKAA